MRGRGGLSPLEFIEMVVSTEYIVVLMGERAVRERQRQRENEMNVYPITV